MEEIKTSQTNTLTIVETKFSLERLPGVQNEFLDKLKQIINNEIEGINSGDEGNMGPRDPSSRSRPTSRLKSSDLDAEIYKVLNNLDVIKRLTDVKEM